MQVNDPSGWILAAIIAGATAAGGLLSTAAGSFMTSANTERETNVELIQLAIGILSEPLPMSKAGATEDNEQTALRSWAVETINHSADIKLDEDASKLLINGQANLPMAGGFTDEVVKNWLELRSQGVKPGDPFLIIPDGSNELKIERWPGTPEDNGPPQP